MIGAYLQVTLLAEVQRALTGDGPQEGRHDKVFGALREMAYKRYVYIRPGEGIGFDDLINK
jgi:hypothetical protein